MIAPFTAIHSLSLFSIFILAIHKLLSIFQSPIVREIVLLGILRFFSASISLVS